ncbi:uncharacterized protein K02A2.6-like [Anastrepha ludens]|uniref:uncharacterized protein K02A2.6-like n=1 Tax=Anastrepha ludens TaxID=28586 RepID=UPI0023B11A91|nr:uncharacterized protein K02A2.6-like [Anastrepha ludens]
MKDEGLQKSLLAEKDLTVQKVIERALSNEAAAISAMAMRHPSEPVNAMNENRFRTRTKNAVNRNQQLSRNGCGGSHPRSMGENSPRRENVNQITPLVNQKKSISVTINSSTCIFEADSGSPVTIMTESTLNIIMSNRKIDLSKLLALILLVVTGLSSKAILKKCDHLFSTDLVRYTGPKVSLQIDSASPPVRRLSRRIPFAIKGLVEEEIDRLCCQGILEPVEYSDWATPIVPVVKRDGSIRICRDYKSTLSKAIKPHSHQIPAGSTLLASIEGGSIYAKIDLAQAYQQLVADERSSLLQTVSAHKGGFKVTRLQFGISSVSGIFQSCIENCLQNILGVLPYFDDIVVMFTQELSLTRHTRKRSIAISNAWELQGQHIGQHAQPNDCEIPASGGNCNVGELA